MFYLEVWGEVLVGLVFVGFVQVVLGQSENQVVSVVSFSSHHHPRVLVCSVDSFLQSPSAAVFQFVWVLLWARDEERVDPEVEHLILKGRRQEKVLVDVKCSDICEFGLTDYKISPKALRSTMGFTNGRRLLVDPQNLNVSEGDQEYVMIYPRQYTLGE